MTENPICHTHHIDTLVSVNCSDQLFFFRFPCAGPEWVDKQQTPSKNQNKNYTPISTICCSVCTKWLEKSIRGDTYSKLLSFYCDVSSNVLKFSCFLLLLFYHEKGMWMSRQYIVGVIILYLTSLNIYMNTHKSQTYPFYSQKDTLAHMHTHTDP